MKSKISLSKTPAPAASEATEETVLPVEQEVQEEKKPTKKAGPEYTHSALSMHRNKFDEWVIVEIKFNPKTQEVSPEMSVVATESMKDFAEEQFRIAVSNKVFRVLDGQ